MIKRSLSQTLLRCTAPNQSAKRIQAEKKGSAKSDGNARAWHGQMMAATTDANPERSTMIKTDILYRDAEFVTGGRIQVLECLKRSVSAVCRNDRTVRKLYIGKGSGRNARDAMEDRYDEYKRTHQINEMIALYETSSERFSLVTEAYLEKYYRERNSTMVARLINRTGGGGGRPASQPYYYLYLAVRRVE